MSLLRKTVFGMAGVLAVVGLASHANAEVITRNIPRTLPSHPGNIFLAGENIVVTAPPGPVETWRALDYENKLVRKGAIKDGKAEVGILPVGWFKIVRGKGYFTNRTFVGVLEPLRAPTPLTSPICIDVGMAWFWPKEKMGDVANLCQLAGINRVRDRLNWQQMEPKRGEFAGHNQYDDSAEIQHDAGLQILQVNHLSSSWANPKGNRFPPDLRDVYNFYREMARRWKGEIGAFEPWNEADIKMFGGHTGSEMATLQKAAYLGLKAGNPDVIACENVFAIRRASTLKDFQNNEAWPYFDTYNLHTYEPLENYPGVYADQCAVSAGKPMWVSECSVHIKWRGDETLKELGDEDLRLQSERLVKTYALAIHEGARAIFYFVLPHYTESKLQYGLLRADLSPRPGYVSLAAVGRLLADAKPVGRVKADDESIQGYVFDAKPDGKEADVLVIWSDNGGRFELPKQPQECFDHLGRTFSVTNGVLNLTRAPMFVLLSKGSRPKLIPPPKPAKLLKGKPGPVVIQAVIPEENVVLNKSAYKIANGETKTIPVFIYNFGTKKLSGRLRVKVPEHWKAELPREVEVTPGERKELDLHLTCGEPNSWTVAGVRINGDFGDGGRPLLSLQFTATTTE